MGGRISNKVSPMKEYGRKPYLVTPTTVPLGEEADYRYMMDTTWHRAQDNGWVIVQSVKKKPYTGQDYQVMESTGDWCIPVPTYQPWTWSFKFSGNIPNSFPYRPVYYFEPQYPTLNTALAKTTTKIKMGLVTELWEKIASMILATYDSTSSVGERVNHGSDQWMWFQYSEATWIWAAKITFETQTAYTETHSGLTTTKLFTEVIYYYSISNSPDEPNYPIDEPFPNYNYQMGKIETTAGQSFATSQYNQDIMKNTFTKEIKKVRYYTATVTSHSLHNQFFYETPYGGVWDSTYTTDNTSTYKWISEKREGG
jgi:hypothetical protein